MTTNRIGVLSIVLIMAVTANAQTNIAAFFRISSPSNAVITEFDPVAGTISWSNDVAGVTNQLQRAYVLNGTSNWVDFVQLASTNGSATDTEHIIDLDAPEGMVMIPGGWFQMGDSFEEEWSDELPVHTVYLSPFYMDKYEVTKELWDEAFHWATNNNYSFDYSGSGKAANHPVHTVSWYDCVKWCNARSEMENRKPYYNVSNSVYRAGQSFPQTDLSANGYRLPTEAEWEKSARGGLIGKRFGWGNTINHDYANYGANGSAYSYDTSPYSDYTYHTNYDDGGYPYTSSTGSFIPNGYGLYDMAGNVWEWCWDWYSSEYYTTAPWDNPQGVASGSGRACRGCGWRYWATYCRSAFRSNTPPSTSNDRVGFRTVLSAE